jgi:hypothetical protein
VYDKVCESMHENVCVNRCENVYESMYHESMQESMVCMRRCVYTDRHLLSMRQIGRSSFGAMPPVMKSPLDGRKWMATSRKWPARRERERCCMSVA